MPFTGHALYNYMRQARLCVVRACFCNTLPVTRRLCAMFFLLCVHLFDATFAGFANLATSTALCATAYSCESWLVSVLVNECYSL